MTGPNDMRVGDVERTKVTEALHEHFAQGRVTAEELDERLEATLSAKTFGDLRKITRDLPGPVPAVDGEPPAVSRVRGGRPRLPFLPLTVGLILALFLLSSGPIWAMFGVLKLIFFGWLVLALLGFMRARRWRRRRWRPGPPPGHWPGPYGGPDGPDEPEGPDGRPPRGGRRPGRGPWDW